MDVHTRIFASRPACVMLAVGLCLALAPGADAQDEDEAFDPVALCGDIEKEYAVDVDRDVEGILWSFRRLEEAFPDADAAGRKAIVACLRKALGLRPTEATAKIQKRAALCLSTMEKAGLKALLAALRGKSLVPRDRKNDREVARCLALERTVLEAVGACRDPQTIRLFLKYLKGQRIELVAGAATALGHFQELPLAKRKPIVEALIKRYTSLATEGMVTGRKAWEQGKRHHRDADHERLYDASPEIRDALRKLTGQWHASADSWRAWYKGHKNDKEWIPMDIPDSVGDRCPVTGATGGRPVK